MPAKAIMFLGGLYGLLAVLLGAFAAHGLRDVVSDDSLSSWQTAVNYQMSHALVLVFTGLWRQLGGPRLLGVAGSLFSIGVLAFSGSIYLLELLEVPWMGPVTPLGGLSLIGGWLCLCLAVLRSKDLTSKQDL
jgi:uncharacterized membrane protein YgdD (TMEM256/DUF423 family)